MENPPVKSADRHSNLEIMRRILILLALGDAIMVIYLALALSHRSEVPPRTPAPASPIAKAASSPIVSSASARRRSTAPAVQDSTGKKLNWRLMSLPDLRECVENLRAVGWPPYLAQFPARAGTIKLLPPRASWLSLVCHGMKHGGCCWNTIRAAQFHKMTWKKNSDSRLSDKSNHP